MNLCISHFCLTLHNLWISGVHLPELVFSQIFAGFVHRSVEKFL